MRFLLYRLHCRENKNAPAVIKPSILGGILAVAQSQKQAADNNDYSDFGGLGFTGNELVLEIAKGNSRGVSVIKDGKIYACEYSEDGSIAINLR